MSSYILALDQGTMISRAIPFDREGNVCASANQKFTQYSRSPAERGCVPSRPTRRGSTYWSRSAALSNGWVGQYHAPPRCQRYSGGHGPAGDRRLRVHDHCDGRPRPEPSVIRHCGPARHHLSATPRGGRRRYLRLSPYVWRPYSNAPVSELTDHNERVFWAQGVRGFYGAFWGCQLLPQLEFG